MWKKKTLLPLLIGLSLLVIGVLTLSITFRRGLTNSGKTKEETKEKKDLSLSEIDALISRSMIDNGFSKFFGQVAIAVAKHETDTYRSKIFLENNNLFGMRPATTRDTTATGKKSGHAVYKDLESSIADYIFYLKANKYPDTFDTVEDYVDLAKSKGYFTATKEEYLTGLQRFIK